MSKVTSKLQVTLPKALAERYGIAPGDDIAWEPAGDIIRVIPLRRRAKRETSRLEMPTQRLKRFDQASARQAERQKEGAERAAAESDIAGRGWTREELYRRGGRDGGAD